ncbi:MAG: hypothetical protein SGJ09_09415 [Phycisphaerae bacterium]|mgnify:CR=1 FL=1|nr:hypothetical protein [Phycisphaerae bacterium]
MVTVHAIGRVIQNFALQHLKTAVLCRDHVLRLENVHAGQELGAYFEEIRSYASACVLTSVASLETLINELFLANKRLSEKIKDNKTEFWGNGGIERKPILEKYKCALESLGLEAFPSDDAAVANVSALIEFRNYLTHYKPPCDPKAGHRSQLEATLDGRFGLSPYCGDRADFLSMRCMSASCASWAVSSTLTFMRTFDQHAELDPEKMQGFWVLEPPQTPDSVAG